MIHNTPQGPVFAEILEQAKSPEGVESSRYVYKLHGKKLLFTIKSGIGTGKKRYFDTQERADEYYKDRQPSKKTHPKKAKPKTETGEYPVVFVARKHITGGPARLPGEPIITKDTKITIAAPPPAVLYRSNTHSYH